MDIFLAIKHFQIPKLWVCVRHKHVYCLVSIKVFDDYFTDNFTIFYAYHAHSYIDNDIGGFNKTIFLIII